MKLNYISSKLRLLRRERTILSSNMELKKNYNERINYTIDARKMCLKNVQKYQRKGQIICPVWLHSDPIVFRKKCSLARIRITHCNCYLIFFISIGVISYFLSVVIVLRFITEQCPRWILIQIIEQIPKSMHRKCESFIFRTTTRSIVSISAN